MLRRTFLKRTSVAGLSVGAISAFIPGICKADELLTFNPNVPKRLVIVFTPNGMVADGFWPKTEGPEFEMDGVLKPLEPFRDQTLLVHGICNLIRGDGDNHMRGISALLTSNELFPGNIVGGSDTPAGWSKGISIDQEIRNFLQQQSATRTRFGSLEFGVCVPNDANPWTRMVFSGPNQPVAPVSDPYAMYSKLYGELEDRDLLLDVLQYSERDFDSIQGVPHAQDANRLQENKRRIADFRQSLGENETPLKVAPLKLPTDVALVDQNMPKLAEMQMGLLVNSFQNDLNRVATLQFSRSVGNIRMKWLDVNEGHHALSHLPDDDEQAQEYLTRINTWYAEQIASLAKKLQETPDPVTGRSMLDNTLIVWTNELGHGNSHTLNNLPFVMVGGGFGFDMGRFTKVKRVSTDRIWLSLAHAMGHQIESFGLSSLPQKGPLAL